MGTDKLFYVKFIATNVPTFLGYIISVLAIVYSALSQCQIERTTHLRFQKILSTFKRFFYVKCNLTWAIVYEHYLRIGEQIYRLGLQKGYIDNHTVFQRLL